MKNTYYIIEKNERLTKSVCDNFNQILVIDSKLNTRKPHIYKTNLSEAKKFAKACGMDVVIYIGSESKNDERVYVS